MIHPTLKTKVFDVLSDHPDWTDQQIADALNAATIEQDVASIGGQELFEALVADDYNALSADQKSLLHAIIGMGTIAVSGTNTRAALLAMFGPGTTTRSNLAALQTRLVSWATSEGLPRIKPGWVGTIRRKVEG
jgi:hypothetical protein